MNHDTDGPADDREPEDSATPAVSPRTMPTAAWLALAVLAAGLVFTTTLALIQWRQANGLRHTESVRRTAASTAGQFGLALFTYDYTDLKGARDRVLRFATPSYAKGYDASSPREQATIVQLKARESARVTGVFLTDVVRNRAAAVVIVSATVQAATGTRSSVSYLDVALVRQGGAWKVDTARAIPVSS
jgi:Mce-associated membrane protein